jgi:hypothetical protein
MINRHAKIVSRIFLFASIAASTLPAVAAENASFDKTFTVTAPVRIELSNGSGNVETEKRGRHRFNAWHTAGRLVDIWRRREERGRGGGESAVGTERKHNSNREEWFVLKNVSIDYQVEVPHDTEIDAGVASGGITIDNVKGPVKASSASGYVHVYRVERDTQLNAASGSIDVSGIGGTLRVSSASGDTRATDVKGEVKVTAASGSRMEIHAARRRRRAGRLKWWSDNDVKACASGTIQVTGNPREPIVGIQDDFRFGGLRVPANASFLLSAESTSGYTDQHSSDLKSRISILCARISSWRGEWKCIRFRSVNVSSGRSG